MKYVLKNIRNNNIKSSIIFLVLSVFLIGVLSMSIYMMIFESEGFNIVFLVVMIGMGYFGYLAFKLFIKSLQLAINPAKDDVFKKYGTPNTVAKILDEIEVSKIYEDKYLIISQNYICDKKDYSKIVACKDILNIHKLVHKTNFVIDYYQIVITDKYNQITTYQYGRKEEKKVNQLLIAIGSRCPNAVLGYTKNAFDYVKENSIILPDEIPKENDKLFCNNCGALVIEEATECPICGEKVEIENNIFEINDFDKKYLDLNKLKELLDKEVITKEEFEKEKRKILK